MPTGHLFVGLGVDVAANQGIAVDQNGPSKEFEYEHYGCALTREIRIHNGAAGTVTLHLFEKLRGDWPSDFELDSPYSKEPDAYIRRHSVPTPSDLIG